MPLANDDEIVAMVTAVGSVAYGAAARQTVLSLLEHTAFPIVVGCDAVTAPLLPRSDRIVSVVLEPVADTRADPFLTKFDTWRAALGRPGAKVFLHVDADAVLVRRLTATDVEVGLGDRALAMVEQTTVTGSTMGRPEFLRHFVDHALRYLAPALPAPELAGFRFHNSGVVLVRALELRNFLDWADRARAATDGSHQVGAHMIADQDYLQVWANVLRRGQCADLDGGWNHCEWWDAGFPQPDARILHFSNFCNGPPFPTARRMEMARRPAVPSAPGEGDRPRTTFVVVTHDSVHMVSACLEVLGTFADAEVVVVDNASTDGTLDVLGDARVIRNPVNVGFAAAVAQGVEAARGEVLCFVNPDCYPTGEMVEAALATIDREPRSVVVPRYVHADGSEVAGRQPGYTSRKLVADLAADALPPLARRLRLRAALHDHGWQWPLAACMFVRADTYAELGGLDMSYFCYMEDVEFGRACSRAGVAVVEVDVPVVHLGAAGSAVAGDHRRRLLADARIAYARRHHGPILAAVLSGFRPLGRVTGVARRLRQRVRR